MTDKEQIICKYKFQDKEKFENKPYCTCFNELCEDLSFVCDHNCQIFEDYKQLARKTQECEQKDERILELMRAYEELKEKFEALKLENQEGYEIVAELKHECEELKDKLNTSEKWRIKAEGLNEKLDLKNTCYRKALEEIERYTREQFCDNCEDIGSTEYNCHCEYCEYYEYFDIIRKAKGEE